MLQKHHVFEVLIEERGKPLINKRFVFDHSDPNILFTDFYHGIIKDDPELAPYQETIQYWLNEVFIDVKRNWFKSNRSYGWRDEFKFFYKYQPKLPFLIRLLSGFSWGYIAVIKK